MDIKTEVLETIKKLYFMCGGNDNIEHLYILPPQWIALLKYEYFSDKIYDNIQNASCTPIKFFVEENFDSWHPKTHSSRNYLQSFYLAALIQKCGKKNNIHLQSFEMLVQEKGQDHLINKVITMELLRRLLIMKRHPKLKKVSKKISMPNSTHI